MSSALQVQEAPIRAPNAANRLGKLMIISHRASAGSLSGNPGMGWNASSARLLVSVLTAGQVVAFKNTSSKHDRVVEQSVRNSARYSFLFPASSLGLPETLVGSQLGRPLADGHPITGVVAAFLISIGDRAGDLSESERAALIQPVLELVRALFCTSAADEFHNRDALAATLGTRIIEYLRTNLSDPELSAARIARDHGISVRALYLLLRKLEIPLGDWIRENRLAMAAQSLSDPSSALVSVGAIARLSGFTDAAYFSRAFRRRFGMTPREWRLHA